MNQPDETALDVQNYNELLEKSEAVIIKSKKLHDEASLQSQQSRRLMRRSDEAISSASRLIAKINKNGG